MAERKGFKSTFGFLMAAVGSAVGLGNIWGFPNKMGANGGFAFLLIYLILAVLCGYIVMMGELALGRKTGRGVIETYAIMTKKFKWLGWMATLSPFLILSFYCTLGGYCLKYMVLNLGNLLGAGFGSAGRTGSEIFAAFMVDQTAGVLYGVLFLAITLVIVMGGVDKGIEKFCSIAMPALALMLLVIILRSCTLPGASEGLKFMFVPNFTPLKENFLGVLATAGGQMFFSLSLGMGIMVTYGSYLPKEQSLSKNALTIIVFDTLVAIMAGLAVLPAAFALDPDGTKGGPALLFVTLQNVFDNMGGLGALFGILFYALVVLAAVTSSISLMEVIVTHFTDVARQKGKGNKRKSYTVFAGLAVSVLMVLVCVDGLGSNGLWVPGKQLVDGVWTATANFSGTWLDFFDMLSEGLMMPLGALLMCVMIGWELGPEVIRDEIEVSGHRMRGFGLFQFCVRFITPAIMVLVLWGQIQAFFL